MFSFSLLWDTGLAPAGTPTLRQAFLRFDNHATLLLYFVPMQPLHAGGVAQAQLPNVMCYPETFEFQFGYIILHKIDLLGTF